jgi:hypothetical protein
VIARFLFETRPIEPTAFAAVAIVVALAAALAAWILPRAPREWIRSPRDASTRDDRVNSVRTERLATVL